ncbi:MAG: hypothetical protein AAF078_10350, partial [Planctomycetota bacterium]
MTPRGLIFRAVSGVLILTLYLVLHEPFTRWTGKWPAPYWMATGLGVVLLFLMMRPHIKHLLWVLPLALAVAYLTWLLDHGLERMLDDYWGVRIVRFPRWFAMFNDLVVPALIYLTLVIAVRRRDYHISNCRLTLALAAFAGTFLALHLIDGMVSTIQIPVHPFMGTIDRNVFGFRLGLYFLFTVAVA